METLTGLKIINYHGISGTPVIGLLYSLERGLFVVARMQVEGSISSGSAKVLEILGVLPSLRLGILFTKTLGARLILKVAGKELTDKDTREDMQDVCCNLFKALDTTERKVREIYQQDGGSNIGEDVFFELAVSSDVQTVIESTLETYVEAVHCIVEFNEEYPEESLEVFPLRHMVDLIRENIDEII